MTTSSDPLWYGPENAVRPVIWALVAAAILARLRRSATLLSIAGVAIEVTRIAPLSRWLPSQVFHLAWVVTAAATVAAMVAVATYGPDGISGVPLGAMPWAILAALPTLAFGPGTVALHRWERLAVLLQRGREAERREVAPGR